MRLAPLQDRGHTGCRSATTIARAAFQATPSPARRLQQRIGNQGTQALLDRWEPRPQTVQPKLTVSQPGDAAEREADRVVHAVMRMPSTDAMQRPAVASTVSTPKVQRRCAECEEEAKSKSATPVQRKEQTSDTPAVTHAIAGNIQALRGRGSPLSRETRAFFEPRFGANFGHVRVHTDGQSAESARSVNALAYTVGNNIVFGSGQYAPNSDGGRQLLAHELTHVLQQARSDSSEVVHRQKPSTQGGPNPTQQPPPAPQKFSPTPGCIVDKTNEHIPVEPNKVTVIEYGADWCGPCGDEQKFLVELCNEYGAKKTQAPVRFFLVDASNDSVKPTNRTWPPLPGSLPAVLVYSGQFQTFRAVGPTTKAEVKAAIDTAISCAPNPLKCGLEEPAGGPGCTIQPAAVPKGKRYRFDINTVKFAAGEEARLEADVKKIKPGARVDLLGLASSDGAASINRILSCQRALTATSVFARNNILVRSLLGSGPVPGTDNDPDFRAVDVVMTDPIAPIPVPPGPKKKGQCSPPTCVPDFLISGPAILRKLPKIADPKAAPAGTDPKQFLQTHNCDPALFQIVAGPAKTSNVSILHVDWQKDPPAGTLSVKRTARDDVGDDPAPAQKAPSFAALNPITGTSWAQNVDAAGHRQACWTSRQVPSWCVPFCSYGRFTMFAKVTWQCDDTECTDKFTTAVFNIDVQKI